MSTVWAVTSGEYSDYSVCGIFDTEDDAKAAVALGLGEDVCQFPYYPKGDKPVRRELWQITVSVRADGTLNHPATKAWPHKKWVSVSTPTDRPWVEREDEGGHTWLEVYAPTKEQAEKVLHDRVAQVRAEKLGL